MLQLHHLLSHFEQRARFLQDHLHLIDNQFQYAGSILMETMLCECFSLVDKQMLQLDWSKYPHSFLVYMRGELKVALSVTCALVCSRLVITVGSAAAEAACLENAKLA